MTTEEKLHWLQNDFIDFLSTLNADQKGTWGVLNAQQMVEHMSDSTMQGNGKLNKVLLTPPEHLERIKSFMLSDKPFKENTKNAEMPEVPIPVIRANMQEAIEELKGEFSDLATYYRDDPSKKVMNPFFGELNYEEWVHLLHKHGRHHARQFGWVE